MIQNEVGSHYVTSCLPFAQTHDGHVKVYQSLLTPTTYHVTVDGILVQWDLAAEEVIRYLVGINNSNALQAKLDAVMLEYCPEDMSEEQKKRWGDHQAPVKFGCHCDMGTQNDGFVPDTCVMDDNKDYDCVYAPALRRAGKSKHECDYWRPISLTLKMAESLKKS